MSHTQDRQPGAELAGIFSRFLAQVIDLFWLLPLSVLLDFAASLVNGGRMSWGGEAMANLIGALIIVTFWVERGGTPGKLVLGLRIVDADTGGAPPLRSLALRYVGYLLSAIPLGLGYLWAIWDPRRQGWHDKIGRTLVIRDPNR